MELSSSFFLEICNFLLMIMDIWTALDLITVNDNDNDEN